MIQVNVKGGGYLVHTTEHAHEIMRLHRNMVKSEKAREKKRRQKRFFDMFKKKGSIKMAAVELGMSYDLTRKVLSGER